MQPDSVKPEEITRFNALAADWWDPAGPMRPLHMMNPVRNAWIIERIIKKFGGTNGIRLLDVGCGAGLLSESLAKAGCDVLGLDAAPAAIDIANIHAAGQGLKLAYRAGTAEALVTEGAKFPVITALEVIEHVADPAIFMATLAALLEPGGLLFISTLNRTRRSWLTAKLGAEYVLRLLPVGTHDWQNFITPPEFGRLIRGSGLRLAELAGISFSPLRGQFYISRDTATNYIAVSQGPG